MANFQVLIIQLKLELSGHIFHIHINLLIFQLENTDLLLQVLVFHLLHLYLLLLYDLHLLFQLNYHLLQHQIILNLFLNQHLILLHQTLCLWQFPFQLVNYIMLVLFPIFHLLESVLQPGQPLFQDHILLIVTITDLDLLL